MSDSLCGSSQHCNSTPEQSVAAQSQHHQQYIGMNRSQLGSMNHLSTDASNSERTSAKLKCTASRRSPLSWLICGYRSCLCNGRVWYQFESRLLADTSHTLPPFPSPDLSVLSLPERITMSDIKKLQNLYRDHCEVCLIGLLLKNVGAKFESLSTHLLGLGHQMMFSTVLEQNRLVTKVNNHRCTKKSEKSFNSFKKRNKTLVRVNWKGRKKVWPLLQSTGAKA